jgi:uncharacterized membrane protein
MKERIWELDFFRGIAIILMVIFHICVLLKDYFFYDIDYTNGLLRFDGRFSAVLFIVIAGISSTLSKNTLKRGIVIFICGMCVTLVTFLFSPEYFVKFGILHFLGLAVLIYPLVKKLDYKLLFTFSITSIYIGNILSTKTVETSYLFPVGLASRHFSSMDYYPLLPWFGVFLFGVVLGKQVYKNKRGGNPPQILKPFTYLGKHSLLIYLIHQPILLGLFYLILF